MNKSKESKLDNLEQIKRLLVLALFRNGVHGQDMAEVLEVSPATISRMLPDDQQIKKHQKRKGK